MSKKTDLNNRAEFLKLKLSDNEVLEYFKVNISEMSEPFKYAVSSIVEFNYPNTSRYSEDKEYRKEFNELIKYYYPLFILYHYQYELFKVEFRLNNYHDEYRKFHKWCKQYTMSFKINKIVSRIKN